MRRRIVRRLALAAVCLTALAACVVNLSFDMDQPGIPLQAPAAGSVSQSALVDLGSYNEISSRRRDIRSLDLDSVDVTITDVKAGTTAQNLSATLSLRKNFSDPPSSDVPVGNLQFLQSGGAGGVRKNVTQRIAGNPAVDAFLLERVSDGGTFYLIVNGTTDGATDIVVDVLLHASMGYDTGLF